MRILTSRQVFETTATPSHRRAGHRAAIVPLLALVLSACASTPEAEIADVNGAHDPYEGFNRSMHTFNMKADEYVLKPAATAYRDNVPELARKSVSNMLNNAGSVVVLVNDVLQWNWGRAGVTAQRLVTNTIEGVGGMVDVAATRGIHRHDEDFGQTLAVWGVDEGPYLVLPLLGPSNPRDAVGRIVDGFSDPMAYTGATAVSPSIFVANAVDSRSETLGILEDIERSSLDYYATLRSLYRQSRRNEILNGAEPEEPAAVFSPGGRPSYDPSVFEEFDEIDEPAVDAPGGATDDDKGKETPSSSTGTPERSQTSEATSQTLSLLAE
ncbi:MAG: VacJ family lipoprotein [Alphaproteobacteria bacterium]